MERSLILPSALPIRGIFSEGEKMKYIIYAFMFIVCACFAAQEGGSGQKESPEYYRAPASLRRLTDPNSPVNLSTPQAQSPIYRANGEYRRNRRDAGEKASLRA
jgi:hypothetical protein